MFHIALWNSRSCVDRFLTSMSFTWWKILAVLSIFGATSLFTWSCYTYVEIPTNTTAANNLSASNSRNNISVELYKVQRTLNSAVEQTSATSYCRIKDCRTVSCSAISKDIDPGTIVSNFMENNFKAACGDAESAVLILDGCKFPANTLRKNWLRTSVPIEGLTLDSCFLSEIEDDAFFSAIYESTRKISMVNNKLVSLRKAMFRNLAALEELTVRQNIIKMAEFNLLEHVADSLSILELRQVIVDEDVLRNITGGRALLKLQILSVGGNSMPTISGALFAGAPAVQSLYLDNSNVRTVTQDTLEPMAASVLQLILNNNNIASLPEGLLTPVLGAKRPFRMSIENNPWRCDCNLKWLQDLVESRSNITTSMPTCNSPQINAGKTFAGADFCYHPVSVTSGTSATNDVSAIQMTTTTMGTVNVICSPVLAHAFSRKPNFRRLLSTDHHRFRSRFPNFYVSKNLEQGILVNVPDFNEGVTLLWFSNDDIENSLGCAKNVKGPYLVRDIDPQTAYTICLLDDNEDTVSPLNCLAVTTGPTHESATWLTNADKSSVFPLSVSLLILCFLLGGFLSFLLIRRHPTLLRGSKRVMLVKRRNVDAIVLPNGIDINEEQQERGNVTFGSKSHEDGYVTPLPPARVPLPRRSRVSGMSSQSDRHSYVSAMESIETPSDTWGISTVENEMDNKEEYKSYAPPLPPHRSTAVPSLSLAVDSRDENYYQRSII